MLRKTISVKRKEYPDLIVHSGFNGELRRFRLI